MQVEFVVSIRFVVLNDSILIRIENGLPNVKFSLS